MKVIKATGLTKEYKRYQKKEGITGSIIGLFYREYETKRAIEDLNLEIEQGEFVGMIGPNGAGKTTLVKMLTGIVAPSSGQIEVLGYYPNKLNDNFKRQYAVVMGQKSQLFFELTMEDTLRLYKEMYELSEEEYQSKKTYLADLLQVEGLMNVQVRTLSLGERMKMELIVALLHNPQLLFLDEPTIGLDVTASKQIRTFLKKINEENGTTIILTSHYMEDIRSLCKRSIVINQGKKVYDGDTNVLFEKYQKNKRITILFDHESDFDIPDNCKVIECINGKVVLEVPKNDVGEILKMYTDKYSLKDISIEEEEIALIVERIYKGEL